MSWHLGKEQRRCRRVGLEAPIRFRLIDPIEEHQDFFQGKTTNLSRTGCGFISSFPIGLGVRGEFVVELPGEDVEHSTEGTVVRLGWEFPGGAAFEYGVEFDQPIPEEVLERVLQGADIVPMLQAMRDRGADSLHLTTNSPPVVRVRGRLMTLDPRPLGPRRIERLIYSFLSSARRYDLGMRRELEFPLVVPEVGRWRVSTFYQRGCLEAVFTTMDAEVPTIEETGLPSSVFDMIRADHGLVLVTGSSSSGKRTTIAALIDALNKTQNKVIVSIERPICYVHANNKSIVKQREVEEDARTVISALKHALHQDADVVAVGEVNDFETLETVLRAAETGHLVLAVLPTANAAETISRIVSMFPTEQRAMVLHLVATVLRGVISQKLLPSTDGERLVLAAEVLMVNETVSHAIRVGKIDQFNYLMRNAPGSQTLDISLRNLVQRGMVTLETALSVANSPDELRRMVGAL